MKNFLIGTSLALVIGSFIAFGQQTLPPGIVGIKGSVGTGNTPIGSVGDSLKVDVTNSLPQPSPPANQNVTVINPSPIPVNGSVSVSNFPAASPYPTPPAIQPVSQSGSWTNACTQSGSWTDTVLQGTIPWTEMVTNFPSVYPITAASPIPVNVQNTPTVLVGNPSPIPVFVSNATSSTVNQGVPGPSPWPVDFLSPQPVTGTFWQTTQPVSGTFFQATQPVSIATMPTTPVTGTFWQTTQPVSGSVSVSNFPVTQPVSGSVSVSNFPVTQPVSGTFWQATQPVSGTFWQTTQPVSIATMPTTPVTGTFWQSVQPVSGSVSVSNFPVTQPVSGTFWQSVQPVSGTVTVSNPSTNYALETGGNLATLVSNQGTSGTGITQPTGGAGMLGWLSGIYKAITNTLTVVVTSNVAPADFVASGSLNVPCTNPASCGAGSTVSITTSGLGNAVLNVSGTWAGTIIVEGSNDGGSTWNNRSIILPSPSQLNSAVGVSSSGYYRVTGVGAYQTIRARMTVSTSGTATVRLSASNGSDLIGVVQTNPNNLLMSEGAGNAISTYAACITNLTISATPTDIFTLTGSATKVVTVLRVEISGTEGTVAMHEFDIITRSSANSGGTFTNPTAVPNDPSNAAATATATAYTVSPATLGTTVGTLWSKKFVIPATTGVDSSWPQFFDFGQYSQGVVLRGTSSVLAVSDNALAIASSSLNICVRWTEQ